MKIRNLISDEVFDAELSTEHSASSYGQAVVVIDGEACDPIGLQVVRATAEELEMLPDVWRGAVALDL